MWKRGTGTYQIDKRFKGIGRIQRASGTKDKKTFRAILTMMDELYHTGKHDVLREIQAGVVTPLEVYGFWTAGKLDSLPSASTLQKVDPTFFTWCDAHDITDTTKKDYKGNVRRMIGAVGNVPIQQLPKALKKYRKQTDKGQSFNRLRTALLAFTRDTFGKHSHLWISLSNIKPMKVNATPAAQLSVKEFRVLVNHLSKPYADIVTAMCLTGMRLSEYYGKWELKCDRVEIFGTKTKTSVRVVPLIQPIVKPSRSIVALRRKLRSFGISPQSFRRTYAHWLEMAGVPRSRRKMYMGHSAGDTTGLYEAHEIEAYLKADAQRVQAYILKAVRPELVKPDVGYDIVESL
jgi:integrase